MPMNDAMNQLRNIYRAARAGQAIDPSALVAAVGVAVAAGVDVGPALRAFDAFAFVWLSHVCGIDGVWLLHTAREQGGWKAAIRMASLLGWTDVWAAAMTAHYGPTGTHPSRLGPDGRPTAETMAECPEIGRRMAEAAERYDLLVNWYGRNGGDTRWKYVVEMKRRTVAVAQAA